jgi:predicted HD phosphohydrolase
MTETRTRANFTSFAESTAEDWAIIMGQDDTAEIAAVGERALWLLRQMDDYGGFPVTRLEHSVQTATRAERAGEDDEYIVCALLHDIGDTLAPYNHASIAAEMLRGFVSEENLFMVEHHGEFQGYYFWHHIGGDRNAREKFRGSPHFDRAAEFCEKYDQCAFDPEYKSEPLEHFEPLLRAFFVPR